MQRKLVEIIRSELHQITLKFYLHLDERNYTFSWSPIQALKTTSNLLELVVDKYILFHPKYYRPFSYTVYLCVKMQNHSVLLKSISSFSKKFQQNCSKLLFGLTNDYIV